METVPECRSTCPHISLDNLWSEVTAMCKIRQTPRESARARLSAGKKVRSRIKAQAIKEKINEILVSLKDTLNASIALLAFTDGGEVCVQKLSTAGVWDVSDYLNGDEDNYAKELAKNPWITSAISADGSSVMVIRDCNLEKMHMNNQLVRGAPHVRFCSGCPIVFEGHNVGALFVMDQVARTCFGPGEERVLFEESQRVSVTLQQHPEAMSTPKKMLQALHAVRRPISSIIRRFPSSLKITPGVQDMPKQHLASPHSSVKRRNSDQRYLMSQDKSFRSSLTGTEELLFAQDMNLAEDGNELWRDSLRTRSLKARQHSQKSDKSTGAVAMLPRRKCSSKTASTDTLTSTEDLFSFTSWETSSLMSSPSKKCTGDPSQSVTMRPAFDIDSASPPLGLPKGSMCTA